MRLSEIFEDSRTYTNLELVKKSMKKYINDPNTKVEGAVWLVNKCYQENGVPVPTNLRDDGYQTYLDTAIMATKLLQKSTTNGVRDDSWKITADNSPFNYDMRAAT